ncbi:MAG: ComF family protein [Pyrinomonadaceae bacterium]
MFALRLALRFLLPFMVTKVLDSLLTVLYPQACHNCGGSVENFELGAACQGCWQKTCIFTGRETVCHKCSKFLSEKESNFQTFCHQCDAHFYEQTRAVGLYENALQVSVLNLKREPFVCKKLRKVFISAFENTEFQDADLIIPIPLSKKRLLERGFNQATVLAKILSDETKIKLDEQSLTRKIHTPMHRAGMDTKARESTVKNAFEVTRPNLVKDKKILLVDDVFTSGATASACAKVLKKAGAEKVYVLTLARVF